MDKSEGNTLLGRHMYRREDNIKMYLKKNWFEMCRLDCSGFKDGQIVGCCDCCNEHSGYK